MKYFEQFLTEADSSEDLDISVHCDVKIFDWLMKYVRDKFDPKIENKNVISILISSDFLRMAGLVDECIRYIQERLHDVVRFPIDLSCLNTNILTKLAQIVPLSQLSELRDRRDKLSSRLY